MCAAAQAHNEFLTAYGWPPADPSTPDAPPDEQRQTEAGDAARNASADVDAYASTESQSGCQEVLDRHPCQEVSDRRRFS